MDAATLRPGMKLRLKYFPHVTAVVDRVETPRVVWCTLDRDVLDCIAGRTTPISIFELEMPNADT